MDILCVYNVLCLVSLRPNGSGLISLQVFVLIFFYLSTFDCFTADDILFKLAVKRLTVCEELNDNGCGSILFYAQLNPPG